MTDRQCKHVSSHHTQALCTASDPNWFCHAAVSLRYIKDSPWHFSPLREHELTTHDASLLYYLSPRRPSQRSGLMKYVSVETEREHRGSDAFTQLCVWVRACVFLCLCACACLVCACVCRILTFSQTATDTHRWTNRKYWKTHTHISAFSLLWICVMLLNFFHLLLSHMW